METIYIHTRFLDTQNASFFFPRGDSATLILPCKAQHMDRDSIRLLVLQKTGATFDIQYLVYALKEIYMWQIGIFPWLVRLLQNA